MDTVWRQARTLHDLGHAMALWLEGQISSWPGYADGEGADDETRHLVPTLALLNRSGFVTTQSQPGHEGTAFDGRTWIQRAFVEGWIPVGSPLLAQIVTHAKEAGLIVLASGPGVRITAPDHVIVTEWAGQAHTGFDRRLSRSRVLGSQWPGVGRRARRQLRRHAVLIAVIDPDWGRDTRMWPVLTTAVAGPDAHHR